MSFCRNCAKKYQLVHVKFIVYNEELKLIKRKFNERKTLGWNWVFLFCFVCNLFSEDLSRAQRAFSKTLQNFSFECIGETQTEDETHISQSLKEFGKLIASIEDERDRMVSNNNNNKSIDKSENSEKHLKIRQSKETKTCKYN